MTESYRDNSLKAEKDSRKPEGERWRPQVWQTHSICAGTEGLRSPQSQYKARRPPHRESGDRLGKLVRFCVFGLKIEKVPLDIGEHFQELLVGKFVNPYWHSDAFHGLPPVTLKLRNGCNLSACVSPVSSSNVSRFPTIWRTATSNRSA